MFDAILRRDKKFIDCTMGVLVAKGQTFYTLERPWLENVSDISCIPTGAYDCILDEKKIIGKNPVYRLRAVPARSGVLIHVGNYVTDSHGCILIGLGRDTEKSSVVSSQAAMKQFIELMGKEFTLSIGE